MAAVKALQQWCRIQCDGYRDVNITNMTTSFRDGLAFCALIHKHRPDIINFDSLKKENVYDNNKLAFSVAEEQLGIPALLDAEDMVALRVPDRLSILTYVSQYYNYFHGRSPIGGLGGIKRPAEAPTGEPAGKKNQPVTAKVFPPAKPARENSPPPSSNIQRPAPSPRQTRNTKQDVPVEKPHQTGTLSNKCVSCHKHVHLVQRHLVEGKLYHRHCAKALSPTNTLTPLRDLTTNTALSKFTPLPEPKTSAPVPTPSRPGPAWLTEKQSSPPTFSSSISTPSPAPRDSQTSTVLSRFTPSQTANEPAANTTPPVTTTPIPAPRTSTTAAKTLQSKLKFFQSDDTNANEEEKKTTFTNFDVKKDLNVTDKVKPTEDKDKKTTSAFSVFNKEPNMEHKVSILNEKEKTTASTLSDFKKEAKTNKEKKTTPTNSDPKKDFNASDTVKTTDYKDKKATITNVDLKKDKNVTDKTSINNDKDKKGTNKFFNFRKDPKDKKSSNVEQKNDSTVTVKDKDKHTTTLNIDVKKDPKGTDKTQEISAGQSVSVVVNLGKKEASTSWNSSEEKAKAAPAGEDSGKVSESSKSKASAAAFISKKLTEENNNNNSKPSWTNVVLKKTEKASEVETPKKEPERVRGRVRLKADPSILADLKTPETPNLAPTSGGTGGVRARTPDRSKPGSVSPHRSAAAENESPSDWRSKLKPVSQGTKPTGPSQSTPKPWANGGEKTTPGISVTPPAPKGFLNGQKDPTTDIKSESETKVVKTKPDYIKKEDIIKELKEIEDNLNELERRGVELEMKLRSSEEEGEDDSVMDELMVEWFNLIRNKQVAVRRESELVYVGRTQDLEEQQPNVEQELRRLMEKPDHLKTAWERRREEELMKKLMEIVNDRNAIIEGLDEDRIREEEEDEELDKMMRTFSTKKDKPKKKSPMSKLFGWGNKKEG